MSSGPETRLHKKLTDEIKARGGHARKVHQSGFAGKGEPDIDGCLEGRSLKIEVKVPGNTPTVLQLATLRKWEAAGALAGWVTSIDELNRLLEHLDDRGWTNPQLAR